MKKVSESVSRRMLRWRQVQEENARTGAYACIHSLVRDCACMTPGSLEKAVGKHVGAAHVRAVTTKLSKVLHTHVHKPRHSIRDRQINNEPVLVVEDYPRHQKTQAQAQVRAII